MTLTRHSWTWLAYDTASVFLYAGCVHGTGVFDPNQLSVGYTIVFTNPCK